MSGNDYGWDKEDPRSPTGLTQDAPRRGEAATELREAVARAIWESDMLSDGASRLMFDTDPCRGDYFANADAVLALPEVAELRSAARCWGYADVAPDGHVNPGAVHYASNEEAAVRLAEAWDGTPVTRLVTEWAALASSSATEPESAS